MKTALFEWRGGGQMGLHILNLDRACYLFVQFKRKLVNLFSVSLLTGYEIELGVCKSYCLLSNQVSIFYMDAFL